jgi:hypothetical protein
MFGQLTNLRSLRGITICLNAHAKLLYHLGFKVNNFTLSTLSRANENRDFRIYQDLAQLLIAKAHKLYVDDNEFSIELEGSVYALDSTIMELCLSTFKWADFDQEVAAVKIHTQFNLRSNIPSFFLVTEARVSDLKLLDWLDFETNAFYVMDRGYLDFERLFQININNAYFVIRPKSNFAFVRLYSASIDKSTGVCCDQIVKLSDRTTRKKYPGKIRRIKYYDQKTDRYYVYLTNNFKLDAKAVADLYKHRWKIELFFKWLKQHLHIEVFWGHSANAVKIQICTAMCTFLLVAILKKKMNINRDLYEILQILSVSQFEKTLVNTLLSEFDLQYFDDQVQKRLFSLNF